MNDSTDRINQYFSVVDEQLRRVLTAQRKRLHEVAALWAEAIADDKLLYVFGSGHSRFIAGELYWRAGGLAPVMPIDDPTIGAAERFEGYAETFMEQHDIHSGDLLVVISNSGINPVPLDVAMLGRQAGATVIALTSLEHSRQAKSRHSSGKRLFEVSDLVLDTMGSYGDAAVPVNGREWRVAPTSTAVSVVMLNSIVAQVAELLVRKGIEPPVLISSNVPEGDGHNQRLSEKYWQRLTKFPRRRAM
jgi:uncharacterized phosphosugar-binding protein